MTRWTNFKTPDPQVPYEIQQEKDEKSERAKNGSAEEDEEYPTTQPPKTRINSTTEMEIDEDGKGEFSEEERPGGKTTRNIS